MPLFRPRHLGRQAEPGVRAWARKVDLDAPPVDASAQAPIIIDHTCMDLSRVPDIWIEAAKAQFRADLPPAAAAVPVPATQAPGSVRPHLALEPAGTRLVFAPALLLLPMFATLPELSRYWERHTLSMTSGSHFMVAGVGRIGR